MRNRVFLLFAILCSFMVHSAFAQSFKVKGRVTSSEDGEGMIALTIMQKGTSNGVVTDFDGNYEIEVKDASEAVLQFSYVGYATQEHTVNQDTEILDVVMDPEQMAIEEVVVVAYGVRKKGTISGSVSTVKAEKLESVPAVSFDQALQGATPGMTVISNSGEPSKPAVFQIRGTNSINSGTSPLFILDGVPITSSDFNSINPGDIESINVLKDASSTSIYGARAANGVVVITTKRGTTTEKVDITLRTQQGFSNLAHGEWNMMNTAERIQFEKEIGLDTGQDYNLLGQTDINWLDVVFNDRARLQSYDLTVSHATDKLNYFVSGGYYDQDGIAQGSTFSRYNLRANVDAKVASWLKMGTNTMLAYEEAQQADDGEYALYTPISACRFMLPYWNPYKSDGSLASSSDGSWKGTSYNPLEWMDNNPLDNKKYKALSVLYAEITPIRNLTLRTQFGVDYSHSTADMKSYPSFLGNNGVGAAGRSSYTTVNLTITNTINYKFDVQRYHHFNVMLGQEGVDYRSEGFQVVTRGQNNDALTLLSSGTRATSWANSSSSHAFLSFFARGEYNYYDRYYADFSLRSDASSRFGKDGRWATFWSLGFMWDMRKEKFMQSASKWLTNAQVALSTGTSGNSSIPDYDHLALVGSGANYMGTAGIAPMTQGNEKLSWEQLWTSNLAIHLGFFGRINADIELYHKKTTNMLMLVPQSYVNNGFGTRWDNVGAMINQGFEVSLGADVISTKDFVWNINANASYNHNEITELYNGLNEYEMSNTSTKLVVGHSIGEFYINRYAGVNPANGDALWYDKNGKITNVFSEDDKVLVGKNYNAPWQGGFGTAMNYKGISLTANFSWVADRWMFNNDRFFEEGNGLYSAYNQSKRLLYDRWKKPGDVTDIPRYGVTPQMDSRFLEDASFLRLKNLMLSYDFPRTLLGKTGFISRVRVYVQAQNLFTWTKFSGLDPESTSNVYKAQYPMSRQYTLGAEITF
ncbi:MAG: TonB-dependent receptor [Bacteroidaceae bacterium]|nr:TonB-dependent receptor [Bacteroidaceae bacterium]